eukprot:GILK01012521.1.p1 GENE.GILK01012521.1~~GILK01012521.1.p1  ORF type:complete len:120 (+),score=18.46 GILK01012521.1:39-398(+)
MAFLSSLPSFNQANFMELKREPSKLPQKPPTLTVYTPTHPRTIPPADQVISTEKMNILLRQFYQHAEQKAKAVKRSAAELDQVETYSDEELSRSRKTPRRQPDNTAVPLMHPPTASMMD